MLAVKFLYDSLLPHESLLKRSFAFRGVRLQSQLLSPGCSQESYSWATKCDFKGVSGSWRCAKRSCAHLRLEVLMPWIFFLVTSICSLSQPWKLFFLFMPYLQCAAEEELMNWSVCSVCQVLLDMCFWAFVWQHAYSQMMSARTWEWIDFSVVKRGPFSGGIMGKIWSN